MSDSFMVAARIRMSREGFETWLDAAVPGVGAIENPEEMYSGWYWNGQEGPGTWSRAEAIGTPREYVARRVERTCLNGPEITILRYRDDALEAYFFNHGYGTCEHALLALAATSAVKSDDGEDLVLYWAETAGKLLAAKSRGWLAVLAVGKRRARFVGKRSLTDAVAGLKPAEESYFDLIDAIIADTDAWDWKSRKKFRSEAPRRPSYVDPAVLA